ncbi:MAG: carbohydrate kinase, partial [Candidatus Omnitrophica bacterium]|nr:carbohydrate kinase [Candidatus Omnitrophota bacterium]
MNASRLSEILNKLKDMRIGVLGDFCLDRYFDIEPSLQEISRETDRPAHQVFRVRCSPGGAGNVATNVKDLGVGDVLAIGPLGNDGEGFALRDALASA